MPVLAPSQPTLHKPKSKLRLRLGLTPPHPKNQTQTQTHLSPVNGDINQLASSTSTTSSAAISRTDSRSAFTYDTTPSPPSKHLDHEFDTISYNTQSPESIAILNESNINASASTLICTEGEGEGDNSLDSLAYPTPSPSVSPEPYKNLYNPTQLPPQTDLVPSTVTATATEGGEGEDYLHPNITSATTGVDDIFSLTDQQLSDRFTFISEIGFGNWGSVWLCKPKHMRASQLGESRAVIRLGKKAAAGGGGGAGGKVAIKLVHRSKTAETAARVRALWGEMKIIRSLRQEPHPSIIQFEAFVITPSYALVIMPHLSSLIPVCLPVETATPYFRQLASAVGYLHERGITHNDIKPANVLLSHNDIPVLVDFGFAQKWDVGARGSFLSSISWGTPEYLDPQRARGMPHDERASDVWSLGITLFEILTGRTPFEEDDQEELASPDEVFKYYDRSRRGEWIGTWEMPDDMHDLLRRMINPDPASRLTAMQAYHHAALQPSVPSVIITPHFVRAAASFDVEEPVPVPSEEYTQNKKVRGKDKKKRKTKEKSSQHPRAPTPALGESIKQHTSVSKPKKTSTAEDKENHAPASISPEKGSKLIIKKTREEDLEDKNVEDDPTPTKITKPAPPLRISQLSHIGDKKLVPRISNSQLSSLSRPTSASTLKESTTAPTLSHSVSTATLKDKRVSMLSSTSTAPKTKDEAVLKTMRSLEGARKPHAAFKAHEALAAVKRPAPSPPRPQSLDSTIDIKEKSEDQRRSLGIDRAVLVEVKEEEIDIKIVEDKTEIDAVVHLPHHASPEQPTVQPMSPPRAKRTSVKQMPSPSPQKTRHGPRPRSSMDTTTGKVFPAFDDESPLAELREKILVSDKEIAVRFRQVSGDLVSPTLAKSQSTEQQAASTAGQATTTETKEAMSTNSVDLPRRKSVEALAMDSRLDKMSAWMKDVEHIIQDARKALAEGREPGLPILTLPSEISGEAQEHRFGVTPDKASIIPAHLRTSSTQVEPATPPKWMTYSEAEEKVKAANAWMEEQGRKNKKERPSVGHVLKLFGSDKEKDKVTSRSNTPDIHHIPLKAPANGTTSHTLRGAPSTPALRSSTTRATRVPLRKSESNLRNFNTMPVIPSPSFVAGPEYDPDLLADEAKADDNDDDEVENMTSPRRVRYENLLSTEPGVLRQGEGWGSLSSGRAMMKPSSSMASLRDRARALLGDSSTRNERHIVDLSLSHSQGGGHGHKLEKRTSRLGLSVNNGNGGNDLGRTTSHLLQRPNTPAAAAVLTSTRGEAEGGKVKGWMKSLIGRK